MKQLAKLIIQDLLALPGRIRGDGFARRWQRDKAAPQTEQPAPANPLRAYFDGNTEGPGIWKWLHYFDAYHRHFAKFIGRPITVVEIGIFSGGSLPMWRKYFGPGCHVHGIDIMPECKVYSGEGVTIHIGDQADRAFWRQFRASVPSVDIVIDDGGHEARQQIITLEEILPHLNPGGVYACEDIDGHRNAFGAFVGAMSMNFNANSGNRCDVNGNSAKPTPFQAAIHSLHQYPFLTVIEKRDVALAQLRGPRHGTVWQPFYEDGRM